MKKLLFFLLYSVFLFNLNANEKILSATFSFDSSLTVDYNKKLSEDFDITRRVINSNRCNTTGIFLLSYSIPTFLWSVVSTSIFSELTRKGEPNFEVWGTTALTSGLLCSGLLCSGLILLIFGAVKYHRYKKWVDKEALFNIFSARLRSFSYIALGGGIATGISTASLLGSTVAMLFYPEIISSYIFCSVVIASVTLLTISLPLMIVCLSLRSWFKKECRRLDFAISQTKDKELRMSVSIPFETVYKK